MAPFAERGLSICRSRSPSNEALLETFACRVFEDNNGALLLATGQRITSCTKYFLVKWRFFWSHVNSGEVEVLKVDTKEQRADYLTKGLSREQYETIRKLVQGWKQHKVMVYGL